MNEVRSYAINPPLQGFGFRIYDETIPTNAFTLLKHSLLTPLVFFLGSMKGRRFCKNHKPDIRYDTWQKSFLKGRVDYLFSIFKSWRIAFLPFEHLEEAFQVAGWQHEKMCQTFLRCIQDPLLSVSQAPRPRSLYPAHQMSS